MAIVGRVLTIVALAYASEVPDGCPANSSSAALTTNPTVYWTASCVSTTCEALFGLIHCDQTELICPGVCSDACCSLPLPPSPPRAADAPGGWAGQKYRRALGAGFTF